MKKPPVDPLLQLKKLLAHQYDLELESIQIEWDAEGTMLVDGKRNTPITYVETKGEIK